VAEQPVPVLLAPCGAGSPSEPNLAVGAVCELLVTNFSDFARACVSAESSPATRAGGLLHNHKVFLLEAAHQVGGCSGAVRDVGFVPPDWVIIPGDKVEVFCEVIVIYSCVKSH